MNSVGDVGSLSHNRINGYSVDGSINTPSLFKISWSAEINKYQGKCKYTIYDNNIIECSYGSPINGTYHSIEEIYPWYKINDNAEGKTVCVMFAMSDDIKDQNFSYKIPDGYKKIYCVLQSYKSTAAVVNYFYANVTPGTVLHLSYKSNSIKQYNINGNNIANTTDNCRLIFTMSQNVNKYTGNTKFSF